MKVISFCLLISVCGTALAAKEAISLPGALALEPDSEFEPWEDFEPLKPVRGQYVAGYTSGRPRFAKELAPQAKDAKCNSTYRIAGQVRTNGEDELFEWPRERFWFYRHKNQALYIEHYQEAFRLTDCELVLRPAVSVVRGIFLQDRLQTFELIDRSWRLTETLPTDGYFSTRIPRSLLRETLPKSIDLRSHSKDEVLREPRGKPLIKNLSERCFQRSDGLDFSTTCYISKPGPLFGRVSFSTYSLHINSSLWYDDSFFVEAFETALENTKIDGRLFEWDREISLAITDPTTEEK